MSKVKSLCKWSKEHDVEKELKKLKKVVSEPAFVCRKCARVACSGEHLCKPIELNP